MTSLNRPRRSATHTRPPNLVSITNEESPEEYSSDPSASEYSDHDHDHATPKGKRNRPQKQPQPRAKAEPVSKARTRARILSLATNALPEHAAAKERLSKVGVSILAKIKKALELANHERTGEHEAKAALSMASKLMSQHSLSQADILAEESNSEKLKRAGMSTVSIVSLVDATVKVETWVTEVSFAMEKFFDCKCYSTSFTSRVDWCFYGLAEYTVAAAYAFEMVYNLILDWSQKNKTAQGLRGKNMYRRGVADGLRSLAEREKREEKQRAIETEQQRLRAAKQAEEEEHRQRMSRLAGPATVDDSEDQDTKAKGKDFRVKIEEVQDDDSSINPLHSNAEESMRKEELDYKIPLAGHNSPFAGGDVDDSDDNDDDDMGPPPDAGDFKADFDGNADAAELFDFEDGELKFKPTRTPAPPTNAANSSAPKPDIPQPVAEAAWRSAAQLVAFREASTAIADDYLRQQDIKLARGARLPGIEYRGMQDWSVYNQGRRDARKIDVKRRRITDGETDV